MWNPETGCTILQWAQSGKRSRWWRTSSDKAILFKLCAATWRILYFISVLSLYHRLRFGNHVACKRSSVFLSLGFFLLLLLWNRRNFQSTLPTVLLVFSRPLFSSTDLQAAGETSMTSQKMYRIEEIPRDEANLTEDEMIIPVSHFFKDVFNLFGIPFYVKTKQGEPLGALKERIQKKCAVSDKEWEKVKTFVVLNRPPPSQNETFLSYLYFILFFSINLHSYRADDLII